MICPECPLNKVVGNIRNLERYVERIWPLDIFNDCFTRKIKFTDLDGIVERNGHFLIIEAKGKDQNGKWKDIPYGQRTMFWEMIKTGKFTVLVLWGEPGLPEMYQAFFNKTGPEATMPKECTLDDIKRIIKNWYQKRDNPNRTG